VSHPYEKIGAHARWPSGVAAVPAAEVDPVVTFPIRLTPEDAIVTAGSCFAQHIARHLEKAGFRFHVTEPGHPLLDRKTRQRFNYGVFSARYGNIYTSRQLEQLLRRAYGRFVPQDSAWPGHEGGWVDPFRPAIQPNGFAGAEALELDRAQHLAAVRRAFEELDVFVFTFGLTECWAAAADGAVFPLAPGVAGGTFDPEQHVFVNLGVEEVVRDMTSFVDALREVNPSSKVILTVSPVPLMATAVDRHVLVSTTYSKSVLRVAAERLVETLPAVYYFPSYEIVTGNFSRGEYFADDLRSIREAGVEHVMSLFFRHATTGASRRTKRSRKQRLASAARAFDRATEEAVRVECDEELLLALEAGGEGR
jgi:hypothetical protein